MELDRTIALLQREQWEKEEEEAGQKERDRYDPKKRITYTLERKAVSVYPEAGV